MRLTMPCTSVALAVALLAACAAPADAPPPSTAVTLPARYGVGDPADTAAPGDWWRSFGSDELHRLVVRARQGNLDIAAAQARLRQSVATRSAAAGGLLLQVSAGLYATREARLGGRGDTVPDTSLQALLTTSYEVDFWGGRSAAFASSDASVRASAFARDTVLLTVTAAAAQSWIDAVALRERIAIARDNLADAGQLAALVDARVRAGMASRLDAAQQRNLLAVQQRALEALVQAEAQQRNTLALRLGQAGGVQVEAASLQDLRIPLVSAGIPSQLLARRPDIAQAEARLAAADADVQVARAAMLPGLNLSLGVGGSGDRLRALLEQPVYTLAANLVAPVFSGGRLTAGHELAQARREELLVDYHRAVIDAFADTRSSLQAIDGLDAQRRAHAEALAQASLSLELARSRYRAGSETLLVLLEAQRALHTARDLDVQLLAARLQASVALYKALGGGWNAAPGADEIHPTLTPTGSAKNRM